MDAESSMNIEIQKMKGRNRKNNSQLTRRTKDKIFANQIQSPNSGLLKLMEKESISPKNLRRRTKSKSKSPVARQTSKEQSKEWQSILKECAVVEFINE